jgi:hypothetical protein
MVKNRADAFGCLAIVFIPALFVAYVLIGFSQMGDMPDERLRPPLRQSAAIAMILAFGPALAVATYKVGRMHRRAVFMVGLLIVIGLYVVVGALWWFRL